MKVICLVILAAALVAATSSLHPALSGSHFYRKLSAVHADQPVRFHVYLNQRNLDVLERMFWDVSNPRHPSYARYLSIEDITSIVGPASEHVEAVRAWLRAHGVVDEDMELASNKDSFKVVTRAAVVEKLFNLRMFAYEHRSSGRVILRGDRPHAIPDHLQKSVHFISGISDFPPGLRSRHTTAQRQHKTRQDPQPGVPQIQVARGNDANVTIAFIAMCKDGSVSQTMPPCVSSPPAVAGINIVAASSVAQYSALSVPPVCSKRAAGVECVVSIKVDEYTPITSLSIQQVFADGSVGAPAVNPFPVVPSPMVTPRTIASLYGIPPHTVVTHPQATQSVVEFEQQYYDSADLSLFLRSMGLPDADAAVVIGPNDQSNPGTEALLDIEYIMGVAPGSPTWFWSIAANSTTEIDDILQWAVAMGNTQNPPLVNSISYGMSEGNVDKYLGPGYLARSDVEFQKLALRGITVIIACGDTGAGDLGGPPMGYTDCDVLHPDWPSQSPYITAVGSTYITPYADPVCYLAPAQGGMDCGHQPLGEVTVSVDMGMRWTTGGGFSNITPRPDYQDEFVATYFNSTQFPPAGTYNPTGRAYPDVAAVGHNLWVAQSGSFIPVDGTSASAPIFAGVVTLLNDARLNAGKQPLGFLNPLLYKIASEQPSAFIDVTVGRNKCGALGTDPVCCDFGYEAAPGFDAVSGLGTPYFPVLRDAVLAAP